ncbi:MAG TPA: DUF885 family protein, partial [Novosphingobium sp.]|nr:DUF885 family protein [Novosphingobium sp.]
MTFELSRRRFAAGMLGGAGLAFVPFAPALAAPADAPLPAGEDGKLMALFREMAKREDALDPLGLVYRGGKANVTAFRQIFTDAPLRARRGLVNWCLNSLRRIDRAKLSPERQISYDVFLRDKRETQMWLQPDMLALIVVRPFNHFGGIHMEFPSLFAVGGVLGYADEDNYRRNLELLRAFPQVLDNAIARFRQGLDSGVVETALTTRNMVGQIDSLLAQPLDESPFTAGLRDFPASVPPPRRDGLRQAYLTVLNREVLPAYRKLRAFLNDEYLPAARQQVGIGAMKGGPGLYRRLIESQTTVRLEPEDVHQLGLAEVARIQRDMDGVRQKLGFAGPLRAFFDEIRTNPRYHPKTKEEFAKAFADAAKAVDAQVP